MEKKKKKKKREMNHVERINGGKEEEEEEEGYPGAAKASSCHEREFGDLLVNKDRDWFNTSYTSPSSCSGATGWRNGGATGVPLQGLEGCHIQQRPFLFNCFLSLHT